jgi:polyphosphate kinase
MVRVAGLKRQAEVGLVARSPEGRTPSEQLAEIAEKVRPLVQRHAEIFSSDVMPALADKGVRILRWRDLELSAKATLEQLFRERIFPVLTPAGRRFGAPVSVHLQFVSEPGRSGARPARRAHPLRPGQGARGSASLRFHAR